MESSRRWWVRPALAGLLGSLLVGLVIGAARGRASVTPREPDVRASPSRAPVEWVAPESSAESSAGSSAKPEPAPSAESVPKPKPRPKRESKREPKPAGRPTPEPATSPRRTPHPTPRPTPHPTPRCVPSTAPPPLALGRLSRLKDARIDESSGLVASPRFPDLAYTMNDEGSSPQIFGIRPSTGATRSAFDLRGAGRFHDPEAISVDPRGRIWLADTGDGHPGKPGRKHDKPKRRQVVLAVFDEPRPGRREPVRARRFTVRFSNGPHNAEALAIHPVTGQAWLISSSRVGRAYRLPNPLKPGRNVARATRHLMPAFVTDATFTADGRHLLVRTMRSSSVLVFDARRWTRTGKIPAPPMRKGESIAVEGGGRTAVLGSEGRHSPLVRIALPTALLPGTPVKSGCAVARTHPH